MLQTRSHPNPGTTPGQVMIHLPADEETQAQRDQEPAEGGGAGGPRGSPSTPARAPLGCTALLALRCSLPPCNLAGHTLPPPGPPIYQPVHALGDGHRKGGRGRAAHLPSRLQGGTKAAALEGWALLGVPGRLRRGSGPGVAELRQWRHSARGDRTWSQQQFAPCTQFSEGFSVKSGKEGFHRLSLT